MQLLKLLREESKNQKQIQEMVIQAGTQTIQTGKMVRGLEIPFHISVCQEVNKKGRNFTNASILTKNLSTSSKHLN